MVYNESRSQKAETPTHDQLLEQQRLQYLERMRSEVKTHLKEQREEVTEGLLGLSLTREQLQNIEHHYKGDPLLRLRTWQESILERIVVHSSNGHALSINAENMGFDRLPKHIETQFIAEDKALIAEQSRCTKAYNSLVQGATKSPLLEDARSAMHRHGMEIPKSIPPIETYQQDNLPYEIESALDLHHIRRANYAKLENQGNSIHKNINELVNSVASEQPPHNIHDKQTSIP